MNYKTFKLLCDGCDPDYEITLNIKELKAIVEEAEKFRGKETELKQKLQS